MWQPEAICVDYAILLSSIFLVIVGVVLSRLASLCLLYPPPNCINFKARPLGSATEAILACVASSYVYKWSKSALRCSWASSATESRPQQMEHLLLSYLTPSKAFGRRYSDFKYRIPCRYWMIC